jgi:Flp pilus assembly protein CpaB
VHLLRRPRYPLLTARRAAAALLAVLALVLALRSPADPAAAGNPGSAVVVAATDLPAGTVLTPAGLAAVTYPVGLAPAGTSADPAALAGRVLAGGVRAGEPVTDARLVGPGLTAGLPAGTVAAPVRLADLAVTALVRTGDRVDVLATADRTADGTAEADVVAAAVLVLAAPGPAADTSAPATGLLLLAVDPATANRLAAASAGSNLTVSLAAA